MYDDSCQLNDDTLWTYGNLSDTKNIKKVFKHIPGASMTNISFCMSQYGFLYCYILFASLTSNLKF